MSLQLCPRCGYIMSRFECQCGMILDRHYIEPAEKPSGPPQEDLFRPPDYQLPLRLDPG